LGNEGKENERDVSATGEQNLLGIGEGHVGAQADHAHARSDALAATEARVVLEFALKGCGEKNDEEIGGGVKDHRESAENNELKEHMACCRGDELRDEGEEEEGRFGIEGFGEDALAEGASGWNGGCHRELGVAGADHADAEPDEVGGSGVFHGVEGEGGGGENRGNTESGGKDVAQPADEGAQGRIDSFATAAGEAARQDVENAGTRCDRQDHGGGEEKEEPVSVEHGRIVRIARSGDNKDREGTKDHAEMRRASSRCRIALRTLARCNRRVSSWL
jgi:hypothetical protein